MVRFILVLAAALLVGCSRKPMSTEASPGSKYEDRHDHHSYGNPDQVRVEHVALDLDVSFEKKTLAGSAKLTISRKDPKQPLILDTRNLNIKSVEALSSSGEPTPAQFQVGASDAILGAPLTIQLPSAGTQVRITYETRPDASGLQWVTPAQTADKKLPFLYSQSQALHARSWIPLQDSPAVRVTYSAIIRTPANVRAVMSARNDAHATHPGVYKFDMPQAIPSYLIALAVGSLEFRSLSKRTGVWAEPSVLAKAADEFADLEKLMQAAERLFGHYQWEQYDVLVLPPSFPYGGMENPRLTFVTPTLIAGDRSLVSVISHELAHSWSGNLVTNATWRDFWLNEGFTTYLQHRIQEEVFGPKRAELESIMSVQELRREMDGLEDRDEVLHIDLKGRDPDETFSSVPYTKGMLLLRRLEELYGRDRFDTFLRGYFAQHGFKSITTADFLRDLDANLLKTDRELAKKVDLDTWLTKPGLPADAPLPVSDAFEEVSKIHQEWMTGRRSTESLPFGRWSFPETVLFLRKLESADPAQLAALDRAFRFSQSGNAEIVYEWVRLGISKGYAPAITRAEQFLTSVGRRKYLKPLYEELAKTPGGKERGRAIFKKARETYHPISQGVVERVLQ